MKCPRCEHKKTYVLKSTRPQTKAVDVCKQRRRTCASCKRPFMTFEVQEADFERLCELIKAEGPTRTPLNRQVGPIRTPLRSRPAEDDNLTKTSKG